MLSPKIACIKKACQPGRPRSQNEKDKSQTTAARLIPGLRCTATRIGAALIRHPDAVLTLVPARTIIVRTRNVLIVSRLISFHRDDVGRGRGRTWIELRSLAVIREAVVEKFVEDSNSRC
jgi:hypothetical protein